MDLKQHHRAADILEKKYKEQKYNWACISFVGNLAANATALLSQTVDSGIEFYPRELRAHVWQTGLPATPGYFVITNIALGTTRNSLYGGGIYSDIFAKENSMPFNFTAFIPAGRNISFTVSEINGNASTVALYLIGEYKAVK